MTDRPDLAAVIDALQRTAPELAPADVPATITRLAAVLAILGARMASTGTVTNGHGSDPTPDKLLTAQEVHERTSLSVAYLYRHVDTLPFFARRVGRKVLFSEGRLTRWLAKRGP